MSSFYERIAEAAGRFPERVAIEVVRGAGASSQVETTTYAQLIDRAGRVAADLEARGIRPGDRVAILAKNSADWVANYLGIFRLGAVAVPLDTAYSPAQVQAVLTDCGARKLMGSEVFSTDVAAPVPEVAENTSGIFSAVRPGSDPDPLAVILYTSGTTADPKGVVLTHGNLEAERVAVLSVVRATEHDAVLGVLPLFHALAQMANLLLPLSIGARVVFLETVSSSTLLEALQSRGITIFACVPQFFYLIHQRVVTEVARGGVVSRTLFRAFVNANVWLRDRLGWNPGRRLFARAHRALGPAMRILITGGSRFDPVIGRDLYGMGFTLLNAYGLTETSGGATVVRPGDTFTSSVGQPLPGVEIRIGAPARSDPAEPAVDGEILIRGPIVMREYFGRAQATAEAIHDGWLHTGDLGRLDSAGRLYITGRSKEIIVLSSGKNLYPEEIEAHYRESPFVKELCVLGLTRPGEPAAERLHAVIVPDDNALRERGVVNIRELIRFEIEGLSVRLPAHKRILGYDISLEPLPRTTTGKLKRHEIERRAHERTRESDAAERPPSEDDQAWLADPAHRAAVGAIALKLDRAGVSPAANLELDLGLDSMERVELLALLEEQHGTRVAADVRPTILSVRHLVDAVLEAPPASADAASLSPLPDAERAWTRVLDEPPDPALVGELARPKLVRAAIIYALIRAVGLLAQLVPGFRIAGREHLRDSGPVIICPNHEAYIDGFFVAAAMPFHCFRQIFFVGAAEYFERPFMAWLARAINIVPVDPDANLVNAMRAGAAGLRQRKVLMLFPEGERSIDGTLKPFRKGAAILASHLDVPIVPVALDGLFELWPRGRSFNWRGLLPWRATAVSVTFGAPMRVERGGYAEGTAAIQSAVAAMLVDETRLPAQRSGHAQP